MRKRTLLFVLLLADGGCSADAQPGALGAISWGLPVAASDGGAVTPHVEAARSENVDAGDGAVDADAEAGGPCDGFMQGSPNVSEYRSVFPPAAAAGGTIAPGTYVLDEVTTYAPSSSTNPDAPPTQPTGVLVRATICATVTSMQFIESRGIDDDDGGVFPPDTVRAEAYTVSGTNLDFTQISPIAGAQSIMPYTAKADLLTLYVSPTEYESFHLAF